MISTAVALLALVTNLALTYYFALLLFAAGIAKCLRPASNTGRRQRLSQLSGISELTLAFALTQFWIPHEYTSAIVLAILTLFCPARILAAVRATNCTCFGALSPRIRIGSTALTGAIWILLAVTLVAATFFGPAVGGIGALALSSTGAIGYAALLALILSRQTRARPIRGHSAEPSTASGT